MNWIEALVRCLGNGSTLPLPLWDRDERSSLSRVGVRGHGLSIDLNPSPGSSRRCRADPTSPTRGEVAPHAVYRCGPAIPVGLLRQMRRQRVIGRLAEERGFLSGGFQKLLVLVVDVVA